jgi:hypothetical protein
MIPAMSVPLGIPLVPLGFPLGIVPYGNFITAAVYFASLVWYDDDKKVTDNSKNTFYDRLLLNASRDIDINCSIVPDKEEIRLSPEGYYVWESNASQTLSDVQKQAAKERADAKNYPSTNIGRT